MKSRMLLLLSLLALSACAAPSQDMYSNSDAPNAAKLTGARVRVSLENWHYCYPRDVDGRSVRGGVFEPEWDRSVMLAPGPHRVFVECTFHSDFGGKAGFWKMSGTYVSVIPMTFNFQAGGRYTFEGRLNESTDEYMVRIVNDGDHGARSAFASAPFSAQQQPSYVSTPIVISK